MTLVITIMGKQDSRNNGAAATPRLSKHRLAHIGTLTHHVPLLM
jgi:hypothetical protein